MSHRILLIEDDPLTQDMVLGILGAKGYAVDAWNDGVSGVEALTRGGYDVALIDYHLPDVDGYSSARLMGALVPVGRRPKLIAITADPESLADREGAKTLFDAVLAKPFAPSALCGLIERLMRDPDQDAVEGASRGLWRERGLQGRPRAHAVPAPTREQAFVLAQYFDAAADAASADILLLLDRTRLADLASARQTGGGHLVPTVDLTGARGDELDCRFRPDVLESWSSVAGAIAEFRQRVAELTPSVLKAQDPATRLMARMFVSGRELRPFPDGDDASFCVYDGGADQAALLEAADGLADRGLLSRTFVDRFHRCAGCGSHRLNVREECVSCRSADLSDTPLLHHFRCARVGPEQEFRQGSNLCCPKCRSLLKHYGSDYERAGSALCCNACGAMNTDPAVGFVCVDCGAHADGERIATRDVHAYALTPRAIRALTSSQGVADARAPLPPAVRATIERRAQTPGSAAVLLIAELRFAAAERLIAAQGWTAFQTLRRLFIENLANLLGDMAEVVSDGAADFVIFRGVTPEELAASEAALIQRCEELLAYPLGVRFDLREAA